jgi:hypothetical protein
VYVPASALVDTNRPLQNLKAARYLKWDLSVWGQLQRPLRNNLFQAKQQLRSLLMVTLPAGGGLKDALGLSFFSLVFQK